MGVPQLAIVVGLVAVAGGLVGWRILRTGDKPRRPRKRREMAGARAPSVDDSVSAPSPRERLRAALKRTRQALAVGIGRDPAGREVGDYLARMEEAFLLADLGVGTTEVILSRVRSMLAPGTTTAEVGVAVRNILRDILAVGADAGPAAPVEGPKVVLLVGVNGVGKTTTIGKLAARYMAAGDRVLLVAADTFRAAAAEQLERWGSRVGTTVVRQQEGTDPAAIVVDGLRAARARRCDIVLIDTAGRLHTKTNLMAELGKIRRVASRECPGAPHETLLVLDATTGQNGVQQARIFKEQLGVTGVVLTKMDGTARGGIAVAVAEDLGIPVSYLGLGEAVEDLQAFDPSDFVDALLGTGANDGDVPATKTAKASNRAGRGSSARC